jgi:hypothetical protein
VKVCAGDVNSISVLNCEILAVNLYMVYNVVLHFRLYTAVL